MWSPDWQALCAFSINKYKMKHDILDQQNFSSYRFVSTYIWSELKSKKGKFCQICQIHKRFPYFCPDLTFITFFLQVFSKVQLQRAFKLEGMLSA